jgi:hypothetical protein
MNPVGFDPTRVRILRVRASVEGRLSLSPNWFDRPAGVVAQSPCLEEVRPVDSRKGVQKAPHVRNFPLPGPTYSLPVDR